MRPKSLLLLFLALGCGLVASIGISQVLDTGEPAAETETTPVLVAMKDISLGDSFSSENVRIESWPVSKVRDGFLTKIEDVDGQRPNQVVYEGEPILKVKVGNEGSAIQDLPEGLQAYAIKVSTDSVANLLKPGDVVDVIVSVRGGAIKELPGNFSKTLLRKITVFAINNVYKRTSSSEETVAARNVSLAVTPEQARMLAVATEIGTMTLVARKPGVDYEDTGSDVVDPLEMLGFKPRETKEGNDPHPGQFAGTEPAAGSGILDVIKGAFDSMKNRPPALGSTGGPEPFRQLVMIDGGAQTFYYTYPDLNKPPQELGENSGMGANAPNSQNSQNDRGASGSGGPGTRNGDGDGDGDGDGSNDGNGDGLPPDVDPDA